ncbi:MAG: filamentous hemagglutinin N-terminal domain-containing protein, partial [Gallionella sp.]|nr:filamentous hemagglutinin N-terminal domain-containing protein [Gallionella sp.]
MKRHALLNRAYKLVWNQISSTWVAVAENAKGRGKSVSGRRLIAAALALMVPPAYAAPGGGQITAGTGNVVQAGVITTITQQTQKLAIDWNTFSIASNEAVRFNQPNASAIALNRILSSSPSQIFGSLTANGQVFILNPNGVLFGRGAQVNVGGLVASTLGLSNADFLAGNYRFSNNGNQAGSIINQGNLTAANGGYIALLASEVRNEGVITATLGTALLVAGDKVTLNFNNGSLLSYSIDQGTLNALAENKQLIQADGGQVIMTARAANALTSSTVNNTGIIEARTISNQGSVIRLEGGEQGVVSVSGTLDASGRNAGESGGTIKVLGDKVGLFAGAKLDASGDAGGGSVLVGGNFHGKGAEQNARFAYVDQNAKIIADALASGNGGKIVVWSDNATRYYGSISARGGVSAGNGGNVEVSGKNYLAFNGRVDVGATSGTGGTLLLDPLNITLTTVDANTLGFTPLLDIIEAFADDPGLNSAFNVNAGGSFAGVTAGSNIILQATNDITVSSAFNVATATGAANVSLTLAANNNINVNAGVTVSGTGVLSMTADADGLGGGTLALNSALISQQGGITLSGASVTGMAAGTITTTGAANQNGGNLSISATNGAVNLVGAITANGGAAAAVTAGSNGGNVNITGVGVTTGAITANGSAAATALSNQPGGAGGAVQITSTGGVTTAAIGASGGAATTTNANGGNAGSISIGNSGAGNVLTTTLTASTGAATGTGLGGTAGSISVTNTAGNITTGAISAAGGTKGMGGNVTINALGAFATGNGAINTSGGTTITGYAGQNAGNVTITGAGVNLGAGTITASGSAGIGTSQAGGNGGVVGITSTGAVTTGAIAASGGTATTTTANGGNAGTITVANNSGTAGAVSLGALTATPGAAFGTGTGGTAGSILVTNMATGFGLSTGAISTIGGTSAHGGNVILSSQGNVTVTGTIGTSGGAMGAGSLSAGRNAGNVTIKGVNRSVTGLITASGGAAIVAGYAGGNGGTVLLTGTDGTSVTAGTLSTTGITASTGAANTTGLGGMAGSIALEATTVTATGALTTTGGANGAGGNINATASSGLLNVNGAITSTGGTANASSAGSNAGNVTLSGVNVTTLGITANGSAAATALSNQPGGAGGAVQITSTGGVTTAAIGASGGA